MKHILIIVLLFISFNVNSQQRIQKGVLYQGGDNIYGPVVGIISTIPKGWVGLSPRDSEAFILLPEANENAQMIVLIINDSIEAIEKRWQNKVEFANGIFIEPNDKSTYRNEWLSADFKVTGSSNHPKGYAEARCGNWGYCTIFLLTTTEKDITKYKNSLMELANATEFSKPKQLSPYDDFDWDSYLENKTLAKWSLEPHKNRKNEVHLCENGTFSSKIKAKGMISNQSSPYLGKGNGTWEVNGNGADAVLILNFADKAPLTVDLKMRDDKLIVNGIQYFVLESDKCP